MKLQSHLKNGFVVKVFSQNFCPQTYLPLTIIQFHVKKAFACFAGSAKLFRKKFYQEPLLPSPKSGSKGSLYCLVVGLESLDFVGKIRAGRFKER
jgi:hypothetical protein